MSDEEAKISVEEDLVDKNENDDQTVNPDQVIESLKNELLKEQQQSRLYEDKFKRTLADFQNLQRKTQSDIQNGINAKIDELMLEFLSIYDDFVRAKDAFTQSKINTSGLDSILKNMDTFLSKHQIKPINALGEIFDPNLHEAISIIVDPQLDENTITKEIRKGYISQNRIIRPTLVEISKKSE